MKIYLASLLFLSCVPVLAQTKAFEADCDDPEARRACTSFNELLRAGDEELLDSISPSGESYACFRPNEDVFSVFRFTLPLKSNYGWKSDKNGTLTLKLSVSFGLYRNGVAESHKFLLGTWMRYPAWKIDSFDYKEPGGGNKGMYVTIDSSEINLGYSYQNTDSKIVDYALVIRRSTGRFRESFKGANGKEFGMSGRCTHYEQAEP